MLRGAIVFWLLCSFLVAGPLSVSIRHLVGGDRLVMNSLRYESGAGEVFSVSRLSYLLSSFELQREDGTWLGVGDAVVWVDLEKRKTRFVLEDVPEGRFSAIRFAMGVGAERNHADPAQWPADHPLNAGVNQLHWNWQDGYIFAALEGRYRSERKVKQGSGALSGFVYHFANDWNLEKVLLPIALDTQQTLELSLRFDVLRWLNGPARLSFVEDGDSTHSKKGDGIARKLRLNVSQAFAVDGVLVRETEVTKSKATPIDLPADPQGYPLKLSRRMPIPALPLDNPLLQSRVELGRKLFFDPMLSVDGTVSCASCHGRSAAFSDEKVKSLGVGCQESLRHSMPLFNLAWKEAFFWDGRVKLLRDQVLHPIQDPREMGHSLESVLTLLAEREDYREAFARAFGSGEVSTQNLGLALECFLLTLISCDSKFDRVMQGEGEFSEAERRGFELFITEYEPRSGSYGADCFHCHGGALFTDHRLHNNGLEILDGDFGLGGVTQEPADLGKFMTPSLRNVAVTAPYMHDGRFATLEEVVRHYSEGVQASDTLDPNLAKHPRRGLRLSEEDQRALVAFLKTLTDTAFIGE